MNYVLKISPCRKSPTHSPCSEMTLLTVLLNPNLSHHPLTADALPNPSHCPVHPLPLPVPATSLGHFPPQPLAHGAPELGLVQTSSPNFLLQPRQLHLVLPWGLCASSPSPLSFLRAPLDTSLRVQASRSQLWSQVDVLPSASEKHSSVLKLLLEMNSAITQNNHRTPTIDSS